MIKQRSIQENITSGLYIDSFNEKEHSGEDITEIFFPIKTSVNNTKNKNFVENIKGLFYIMAEDEEQKNQMYKKKTFFPLHLENGSKILDILKQDSGNSDDKNIWKETKKRKTRIPVFIVNNHAWVNPYDDIILHTLSNKS